MQRRQHPGQTKEYWLSKRLNSDAWCRTWYDSATRQTKRASLRTEDFQEAESRLIQWVAAHAKKRNEQADDVSLEELFIRYYEQHAKHTVSAEQARYCLANWSDFFPGASVSDLTPDRQDDFVGWLRTKGYSDGYVARILTIGRAALNRAYKRQEIAAVPFIASVEGGSPRENRLTLQEAAKLFDAIQEPHLFMYCMVAFNTLARPHAILELTRWQVDLENRLIHFNAKGRRQTKKYRPVVPITNTLLPWLQCLKTVNVISYSKADRQVNSIKTSFNKTVARAGLEDVMPYTIRHTLATELRKRGVPPWEVGGMLGHRSGGYKTTEIYAKYDPDYMSRAVQAIDGYFEDLQALVKRPLILRDQPTKNDLRANCVLAEGLPSPQVIDFMVGASGIEPPTTTMSR